MKIPRHIALSRSDFLKLKPIIENAAQVMLFAALAAAFAIFALHVFQAVRFRYPLDYGEAPLVDQALRLAAGKSIYRPDLATPPYTVSNYPPLYPLALALLVRIFGPSFVAGRLISILCAVLTALLLGKIIGRFSHDRVAAAASGLLFLAFPYVIGWSKLARVDLLALALSLAGLYLLIGRPVTREGVIGRGLLRGMTLRRLGIAVTWGEVIGGGLLLVAAIYTRQSYALAAPLAAFAWLWTRSRRHAIGLAALVGGLSLALFLILNALTGGGFLYNIVTANVNAFQMDGLARWWRALRSAAPILLLLGGLYLGMGKTFEVVRPHRPEASKVSLWPLLASYLIGAALSALTIVKIGSNMNYLLELCAALSLVTGAWVAWSRGRPWLRAALLLLLALQVGLLMRASLADPVEGLQWRIEQPQSAFTELEQIVAGADGPILADEFMGLLTLQNKPLYIQPFEVTQLANAGLWDQSPLLAGIRAREFPAIFIHHFKGYPVYEERWTKEMLQAVMTQYEPTAFLAETIVYRPRDPGSTSATDRAACPGASWRLPTRSELGTWWLDRRLIFMGEGYEGRVPVYAVADGLLTRRADWYDAVAVQHDDPLRPGQKVWTFYGGLASAWGYRPFIAPRFSPGSEGIPVQKGDWLGDQGLFFVRWGTPYWVHLEFAVLPAEADGAFPAEMIASWFKGQPGSAGTGQAQLLDPSPYLGIASSDATGQAAWMPLRCR